MSRKGNLFVISGPSGAGKGTLVARLLEMVPDTWVSISCTTRSPREGEKEGVHYYFKTRDEFMALADQGGLLEWAEYSGNCYGTPRQVVEERMAEGMQVILEIDVQGGFQIREKIPAAHLVFIEPPSMEVLEQRLRGRGTETEEAISRRLDAARVELSRKMEYDYVLVNDDLDEAAQKLADYVNEMAEGNRG
ncbi:MAG: guanylate kinase [Coriobacteriia bacterium]|nr:guanylate kinase [Coriobacteriia bacterium]